MVSKKAVSTTGISAAPEREALSRGTESLQTHRWREMDSNPRSPVMDGDLGRQVPALIAVFELARTAVALTRGTKVVGGTIIPNFRKR